MFACTLFTELRSQGTNDYFKYPLPPKKNPYLNQAIQKIFANFRTQKKSRNRKFETQKNPLIIPVT